MPFAHARHNLRPCWSGQEQHYAGSLLTRPAARHNLLLGGLLVCSAGLNVFLLLQPQVGRDSQLLATGCDCAGDQPIATRILDAGPTGARRASETSESGSSSGSSSASKGAASSGSSAVSGGSAASHGGGSHPQDALYFLFIAVTFGAGIMHINSLLPKVQQTVVLFVAGIVISLFLEGLQLKEADKTGPFGMSYEQWMGVDPHLLLFALLPLLLAGDAMTIDTNVAKRVGWQCMYLAGPGVVVQAFVICFFLQFFLGWSFFLSLVMASILCATDPVAVVALLKELGASPVLTVQIQGESLFNDGTAIVLFSLAYQFLSGDSPDFLQVCTFLVHTAVLALALGAFIGYVFYAWIRAVANRLNHNSTIIQIVLTLCCAYWSFILAEGVFEMSGVLSTVAASLVLARHMWPHIVHKETVHHVWHTFESLGNMVIFFLAGAITGKTMVHRPLLDYLRLLVIYVALTVVRFCFVFLSRPVLQSLNLDNMPVSAAEAAVITWGGLRGALGVTLAIQVFHGRAPDASGTPQITEDEGERVLFFVCGVALLTTIVNATTAPWLVEVLGITGVPQAQKQLLRMMCAQLATWSEDESHPPAVSDCLRDLLADIDHAIEKTKTRASHRQGSTRQSSREPKPPSGLPKVLNLVWPGQTGVDVVKVVSEGELKAVCPEDGSATNGHGVTIPSEQSSNTKNSAGRSLSKNSAGGSDGDGTRSWQNSVKSNDRKSMNSVLDSLPWRSEVAEVIEDGEELVQRLLKLEEDYQALPSEAMELFGSFPAGNLLGNVQDMVPLIQNVEPDPGMAKVVNRAFLSLVQFHYWKRIEQEKLLPGSQEAEALLYSVNMALSNIHPDLDDFKFVVQELHGIEDYLLHGVSNDNDAVQVTSYTTRQVFRRHADRVAESMGFQVGVGICILLSVIYVLIEEIYRDSSDAWIVIEAAFVVIFAFEMTTKILQKSIGGYLKNAFNAFDALLVFLGAMGVFFSSVSIQDMDTTDMGSKPRIVRIARLFRLLRFLRVVRVIRLLHARLRSNVLVSENFARHMTYVAALTAYIMAHLESQQDLIRFFGGNGKVDEEHESELARCIVQSQCMVYEAIDMAVNESRHLDSGILLEVDMIKTCASVMEYLESYILSAHHHGALSAREAESILGPMHERLTESLSILQRVSDGILRKSIASGSFHAN